MPKYEFTEEERGVLTEVMGQKMREDRFPFSPRLATLKRALAKLDRDSALLRADADWPDPRQSQEAKALSRGRRGSSPFGHKECQLWSVTPRESGQVGQSPPDAFRSRCHRYCA
jgi:hypothetical protein